MALKSFFGLLTLQVGATILAAVFFTLAGVILFCNAFRTDSYYGTHQGIHGIDISQLLVLIATILFIVVGVLAFLSSYNESRSIASTATFVLIVLLIYWLALSALSFFTAPDVDNDVCVYDHCPETFWLVQLHYKIRDDEDKKNGTENNEPGNNSSAQTTIEHVGKTEKPAEKTEKPAEKTEKPAEKTEKPAEGRKRRSIHASNLYSFDDTNTLYLQKFKRKRDLSNKTHTYAQTITLINIHDMHDLPEFHYLNHSTNTNGGNWKYTYDTHFFATVLIFIINLVFIVYSVLILWSWANELKCTYYDDEENSY